MNEQLFIFFLTLRFGSPFIVIFSGSAVDCSFGFGFLVVDDTILRVRRLAGTGLGVSGFVNFELEDLGLINVSIVSEVGNLEQVVLSQFFGVFVNVNDFSLSGSSHLLNNYTIDRYFCNNNSEQL